MVETVIVEEGQCHQQASRPPNQPFLDRVRRLAAGGLSLTALLRMLCCHEILVVEKAEQWSGEEAGGDPPRQEGEEAPKEQGAENSPQASQGYRELGHWHAGLRNGSWARPRRRAK